MVGRRVSLRVDKAPAQPGEAVLEVADLVVEDAAGVERVKGVSFAVRRGEIVGIAGVAGNGQSELLEALAGIRPVKSGRIRWQGRDHRRRAGRARRGACGGSGCRHVPEDRQRMGLIMPFAARESAILGYHDEATYNGALRLRRGAVAASFRRQAADYDIRPADGARRTVGLLGRQPAEDRAGPRAGPESRTCSWSGSPRAAWTSAPSSSSTGAWSRSATRARRSCWSRSSWTRSSRSPTASS